eukprot:CAMPEP_0194742008 /NCGR_PEP_ID=MMETSP0296-20130528/98398_1 /TAXON_ID=39354 /ORGANISM="Heterosigma akashiwo, Strain CCMP2393" /LENGTH=39 /DNA_ID= /DNA_START= /DNA_END= /DNA_ORIENTATION=
MKSWAATKFIRSVASARESSAASSPLPSAAPRAGPLPPR